jgi:hypothetical protein
MSGNGSYIKSMNGIVSFDSGGTTIEGGDITADTVNCDTLNATTEVNTNTINTSTIYADFILNSANPNISIIGDTKFNNDLYVNNIYSNSGGLVNITNLTSNSFKTESIDGRDTSSLTKELKIGQSNLYTTSVNIGRAELNILGTIYPAIPPRTTFQPVGDDDICNKFYVDSVATGTIILGLTNTFTGTSNTFNNTIITSKIDSITPSATYEFLTSHTGEITVGSSTTNTSFTNTLKANRIESTTNINTFALLSSHTARINIGNNASSINIGSVTSPARTAYTALIGNDLCNKTYVDSVAGTSLLSATNVWTGTSNTFNNVVNVNSISAPSGTLTINSNINCTDVLSTSGDFQNPTATSACRFARTTTSGTVNIATNQTTGTLNIGTFSTRTGDINIGATTSTTTINGQLNCNDGTSIYTVWGKLCVAFTGGFDYNIVSEDINNIFMLVINGGNPRVIQMPARKIGQYIIIRSISGVSHTISVSLISGGNFYNPNATTTSLSYSMPSGTVVRYLDNGSNWIAF